MIKNDLYARREKKPTLGVSLMTYQTVETLTLLLLGRYRLLVGGSELSIVFCLCKVVVNYAKSGMEAEQVCREVSKTATSHVDPFLAMLVPTHT